MNKISTKSNQNKQRSLPERLSFGIAILIVGLLILLIIYQWKMVENQPPILSITVDQEIRHYGTQYYVPFTVSNTGGETAKSVQVLGKLQIEDINIQEEGEQLIDFLSGGEKASGAFVFTHHPKLGKLTIRVASYKLP